MQVERVQKWVMSTLLLTTGTIFAGGLALLAGTVENKGGARPGLLVVAGMVGLMSAAGVRVINQKSVLTPWLLGGLLPAALGWLFIYQR